MDDSVAYFIHSTGSLVRELGQRIRRRRIAAALTQTDLAKRAGVSRTTVTRVERGQNVGVEALAGIAIALDAGHEFAALFPERDARWLDEIIAARRRPQRVRPRKHATPVPASNARGRKRS